MTQIFGLFVFLLFWTFNAGAQTPTVIIPPPDFKITAMAGAVGTSSTISKIDIDAQGHAIFYSMTTDDQGNGDFKKINEFTIDPIALKRIYETVAQADFFNLKENYKDEGSLGGSFAEITVSLHGQTHTVRTQNFKNQAFDDINVAINLSTPKENKILYNAIL